jgi:hypothetical protein
LFLSYIWAVRTTLAVSIFFNARLLLLDEEAMRRLVLKTEIPSPNADMSMAVLRASFCVSKRASLRAWRRNKKELKGHL